MALLTPQRQLLFSIAVALFLFTAVTWRRPDYTLPGFVRGSSSHLPSSPYHLLLSIPIREDAAWLTFLLNVTTAALSDVAFTVVLSTTPALAAAHAAAAAQSLARGRVIFSAPFEKYAIGGDLTRAHARNLRAASSIPYTHAVLLASNALWVRAVDPLALAQLEGRARFDSLGRGRWWSSALWAPRWVWADAAQSDACVGAWLDRHNLEAHIAQIEGLMLTRRVLDSVLPVIEDVAAACRGASFPHEELVFASVCARVQSDGLGRSSFLASVAWRSPGVMFPPGEVRAMQRDPYGPLLVKRVPRDANDEYTKGVVAWRGAQP
jgi:hypothetical protein